MALISTNPATGEEMKRYPEIQDDELDRIIGRVDAEFGRWRLTPMGERAEAFFRLGGLFRERAGELAELMAAEMGKPVRQGKAESEKCAWVCEYYAKEAEGFLAPEDVKSDASRSFVTFEPLGVILAIMPWNFPFWQVMRFAAPTLMAGNAAVLKHASNVSGCALAIEGMFREAGFPEHLFRTLLIGSDRVEAVIRNPKIRAVTLTGSVAAGKAVAAAAGSVLKKAVLELGGSDAYLVLADADLERAAEGCVTSRLINSGQSCIAAKRFLVVDEVRGAFERLFMEKMKARSVGDPRDARTDVGPLARIDLREDLHRQVLESIRKGAKCLLGGEDMERRGAFYSPTVLTDVSPGMPAFDEENFGPVAAIVPVADEEEAIRLANQSVFGLGAAVFTRDARRGEEIAARRLEAGSCFVNDFVKSDPRLPFGGVKESGYGRELGLYGIREFVNVKTVYVA
jgi:succinate-semialdehyde dehydrogenase / glutarate-semialdehyde dehydrogenase